MNVTDNYKEQKIQNERKFMNLLLKNQELIDDYLDSGMDVNFFEEDHRHFLRSMVYAAQKGFHLTESSFDDYLKKVVTNIERQAHLNLFDEIASDANDRDDFPSLMNKIIENHVKSQTMEFMFEYEKDAKHKSSIIAARKLKEKLDGLVSESVSNRKIVYADIREISKTVYEEIADDLDNPNKSEEAVIVSGIKEIDHILSAGFEAGSITLFCGDTGGFKCGWYKNLHQIVGGERIDLEEIHKRVSAGQTVFLQQLNESTGKIITQPVSASFDSGVKYCYRITTSLGHEIVATAEHRHRLFDGYQRVSAISAGDYLAITRRTEMGDVQASHSEALFLGLLIAEGSTVSGCRFTNYDADIVWNMRRSCIDLGGSMICKHKNKVRIKGQYEVRDLYAIVDNYGLRGCKSVNKTVHSSVFRWNNQSISIMLHAMFSCDGRFLVEISKKHQYKIGKRKGEGKRKYKIMYCTSSNQLAKDVRDLLLRFGIIASIFEYNSYYKGTNGDRQVEGPSWRVEISDATQIIKFIKEIGFIGKKQKLALKHLSYLEEIINNPNRDIIPSAVWNIIDRKFKEYGKSRTGCRRFYRKDVHSNWKKDLGHCGSLKKSMSRDCLRKISHYLDDDAELLTIANSDVYWDRVVSIEPIGLQQTYDLSMPGDHNFVANNIVTHNSTMMMNCALNIWKVQHKNVLYIPLEMPQKLVMCKILSRETKVLFEHLIRPSRIGLGNPEEEKAKAREIIKGKIKKEIDSWDQKEGSLFLMDCISERAKVSVLQREIEKHLEIFNPDLVVVDYIANLEPDKSRSDRNDLEIGEILYALQHYGHAMSFAVISGAQVGREALKRHRKAGGENIQFFSEDVRGSHEYSSIADNIFFQMKDENQPNERLNITAVKSRWGPTVFLNGESSATLYVNPAIGLITSAKPQYESDDTGDILDKVNNTITDELDFEFDESEPENLMEDGIDVVPEDDFDKEIFSGKK